MARPKKLVHGIGFNDLSDPVLGCPFYDRWCGMLRRCYSKSWHSKHPSYIGVEVCKDWHLFSNFKSWMQAQDWTGKHLDKDLLGDGKIYSPETCCFLPQQINKFIKDQSSYSFSKMIGVHISKFGKFEARIKDFTSGKLLHIGTFDSEADAHNAWLSEKVKLSGEISKTVSNRKIAKALENLYVR